MLEITPAAIAKHGMTIILCTSCRDSRYIKSHVQVQYMSHHDPVILTFVRECVYIKGIIKRILYRILYIQDNMQILTPFVW